MDKIKICLSVLLSFLSLITFGQITVVTADKGPASNGDGLYYSLPATVFKVEVDIKKTEFIPGPLASYTENYLGTSNYIKNQKTEFSLVDVDVKAISIADEKASYYMVFSDKGSKENKLPVVQLTSFGTLKSINMNEEGNTNNTISVEKNKTIILGSDSERFNYEAEYNRKEKIDTVVRKITIDTMTINKFLFKSSWVDKSREQRAEEAAHQIRSIRDSRMNLLTGYHEVNFGESLLYMDHQLQKIEQQYLELFLGKEHITFEHYTFFVMPEKGKTEQVLLETESADKLVFVVNSQPLEMIKPLTGTLSNVVYYRIPAQATIKVDYNGETFYNNIVSICQLGVVTGVSVQKAGVLFDEKTGVPIRVKKY